MELPDFILPFYYLYKMNKYTIVYLADFLWESAKQLDAALTANGLDHTFYVSDGGHVWANWRLYLNTFAQLLFK